MSTYVKHAKNCKIAVQKNHLIPFRHIRTNKRGPAQKNQGDQYERTNIRRPTQEDQEDQQRRTMRTNTRGPT